MRHKNYLYWFLLMSLSIFGTFIICEVTAWSTFYFNSKPQELSFIQVYQKQLKEGRNWVDFKELKQGRAFDVDKGKMPHPYLGFVEYKNSNTYFGIDLPYAPEAPKLKSDFIVAILGGSLSSHFCQFLKGHLEYQKKLEILFGKRPEQKSYWICAGMGSAKMPQTFSVLAHYGQYFDVTINLDGFNEVTHDVYPDHPLDFPFFSNILFPRGKSYAYPSVVMGQKVFHAQVLDKMALSFSKFPLNKSAILYWVWKGVDKILLKVLSPEKLEVPLTYLSPNDHPYAERLSLPKRVKSMVDIWQRFTLRQWWLAQKLNVKSFFFLQPNQYEDSHIKFIEDPRWIKSDKRLNEYVKIGYPFLKQSLSELKKNGLPIFDLTSGVKSLGPEAYVDSCCHLKEQGLDLLTREIIKEIKKYYESQRTQHLSYKVLRSHKE